MRGSKYIHNGSGALRRTAPPKLVQIWDQLEGGPDLEPLETGSDSELA